MSGKKDSTSYTAAGAVAGWELQNMLTVAQAMIGSALRREESRCVHSRSDYPERDEPHWKRHIICPPMRKE